MVTRKSADTDRNGDVKSEIKDKSDDEDSELVPPEGGWGFVVCLGVTVIFIAGTAHLPSLGFIYGEFLEEQGDDTGALATLHGSFSFMVSFGGFCANIFLKRYNVRRVGVFGATILTLGGFLGIFMQSTFHLIFTIGIIQGYGFGILTNMCYTSYNSYFTVKRVLYMSLSKAGIGLVIMMYPFLLKYTMEEFGFRGTLAFVFLVTAHSIPGAMVLHPVSWHMIKKKKVHAKVADTGTTSILARSIRADEHEFKIINDTSKSAENLKPLLESTEKDKCDVIQDRRSSIPAAGLGNKVLSGTPRAVIERFGSNDEILVNMQNEIKAASMLSVGNFGPEPLSLSKKRQGKWHTIMEFLDLNLLKDPIYTNISMGMAFSFFADMMFFALEPLLLNHYKYNKTQVTSIISIGGATDMAGKLALGLVGQFYKGVNSRYLFYSGSLLAVIIRTIFVQYSAFEPVLILTGILGLVRAPIQITPPLVMAAHVPIEKFAAAYGLYLMLLGVVNITIGPIIGYAREISGSYPLMLNLLSLCNLLCVIPWTIEALIGACRKRKQ